MKRFISTILLVNFIVITVHAQNLQNFVKACALGTLSGAAVGLASLAVEDKPDDSWNNVARGASLGLYAGTAYGLYQANKKPQMYQEPEFVIAPKITQGQIAGLELSAILFRY